MFHCAVMARSGSFGDSRDLDAAIQDIGMHHKSPSTGTMSVIGSGATIGRDHHHSGRNLPVACNQGVVSKYVKGIISYFVNYQLGNF